MYSDNHKSKIKNDKIQRWRLELSCFRFDVVYRPGRENQAADALSRGNIASLQPTTDLVKLHDSLCHPGVTRMLHFVRSRNLAFSVEDIKRMISQCRVCAEIKPRFFRPPDGILIKATQPFERLSVYFKGPLPSASRNKYLFTVIDEYSRFPFGFPCSDMSLQTVINCLISLFSAFGMPHYIHSDRGSAFISD